MKKIYLILLALLPFKLLGQCHVVISSTSSTLCSGSADTLVAQPSGVDSSGISYTWTYTDSITHTISTTIPRLIVTPYQTTSYVVIAHFSGACTAYDTTTITVGNGKTPTFVTSGCASADTLAIKGGGSGMTYQWYQNGASISTDSFYIATMPAIYQATANYGSSCSYSFGPVIYSPVTDPLHLTIIQENVFSLNPSFGGASSFQWYKNGAPIAGAINSNYFVDSTLAGSGNSYYNLLITSFGCSLWSDTVTITTLPKPVITSLGVKSCTGVDTLKVASAGAGATYHWNYNGQPIAVTTDSFYVARYSGSYTVSDSLASGFSPVSNSFEVDSLTLPLKITHPGYYPFNPTALCTGDSIFLSAPYLSSATYQWYLNSSPLAGQTNASYTAYSGGNYSVQISFTGGCTHTVDTTITQTGIITDSLARNLTGDSLILFATGGTAPYDYVTLWTDYQGIEGNSIYIDSAGSYAFYSVDANGCKGSNSNTIVVTLDTLSGHVYNSSFSPVGNVPVYIVVQHADNSTAILGSDITDNGGNFNILTIATRGYAFAVPIPADTISYLPTYDSSAAVIQDAFLINFYENIGNASIVLIDAGQSGGSGEISGVVDSSSLPNGRVGIYRTAAVSSGPTIAGLKIVLLNANNQPVATTTTDANGRFRFTNLANGNYKLWVDGYGINNATAPVVTVSSASASSSTNLQFAVSGNSLARVGAVTGVASAASALNAAISIYPNPASSSFTISVYGSQFTNFSYTLADEQGHQITKGQGNSSIDVTSIEPGFYILSIKTAEAVAYQKVIVER